MKRRFSVIIVSLFMVGAFSESYETLLSKAKEYESKKEYVYAMGYYYDAMNAENAKAEAKDKFYSLSERLKKGADGLGLSFWDDPKEQWQKVIKEFYKYFTEFSPYEFYYLPELKLGEVDYKNRTVSYLMEYEFSLSEKFMIISKVLTANEKTEGNWDSVDWWYSSDPHFIAGRSFKNFDCPYCDVNYVPHMSFSFDSIDINGYMDKIQAIGRAYKAELKKAGVDEYSPTWEDVAKALKVKEKYTPQEDKIILDMKNEFHSEILKFYAQTGIALTISSENFNNTPVLASFASFSNNNSFIISGKYSPYDLQFGIYDKTGKLLLKGTRQYVYSPGTSDEKSVYSFSGVTESIMNSINNGDYTVKPVAVYLNYGAFRSAGFGKNATWQDVRDSYIRNVAEIKQNLDKCRVIDITYKILQEQEEKRVEEARLKEEERLREQKKQEEERKRKEEEERRKEEERLKEEQNYATNYKNLENFINNFLGTQKKYGLYFDMEQDKEGYHVVTNVIPDSAADKAGIKVGAKIMFDAMPMIDETIFNAQYVIDKLNKPNTMRQLIMPDYSLKWDVVGVLNHEWVVIVKTENGYGFASVNGSDSISLRVVQDSNYVITRLFIR